jgi:hypothetical protein
MKKLCTLSIIIASIATVPAHAGFGFNIWNEHVTVSSGSASGMVTALHRQGGTNEYIYCQTTAIKSGTTVTHKLTCEAQSLAGTFLKCERAGTENDNMINVVGMINKSSEITFHSNTQGQCTNLFIENFSYNLEKVW